MAEAKKYLADADTWYLPHKAEVEAAQREMGDHIKLLRDAENALGEWAGTHAAIAKGLQTGLQPDWTLLKASAERIESDINKITNKDHKQ